MGGALRRVADLERQVETLKVALEHRTTIGKALGIMMERLDIDDQQAFAYLCRCSQDRNEKLYDLAVRVVEIRELPDAHAVEGASQRPATKCCSPKTPGNGGAPVRESCA